MPSPGTIVRDYHQRSKHSLRRYAAGPRGLDWANQPDPFRRFAPCPEIPLPLLDDTAPPDASFDSLYQPGTIEAAPLTLDNLAIVLQLAFGLSAWKRYSDNQWALRNNPSSGNLHPTEGYVITPTIDGLECGLYHYRSFDHLLEQRCRLEPDTIGSNGGFLVGLSTIFWREAWKYGERAFRYCQHDAGHALAALRYACGVLGWSVTLLDGWSDDDITTVLGLDRDEDFGDAEPEHPDMMLLVSTTSDTSDLFDLPPANLLTAATTGSNWQGRANHLSPQHGAEWPIIETVATAAKKPRTEPSRPTFDERPPLQVTDRMLNASKLIRQRRSAQAFDGSTTMSRRDFYRLLDRLLPRPALPPFDALPWRPRIHLILFVHRIEQLVPGIYLFTRHTDGAAQLRKKLDPTFEWTSVTDCPSHLPLHRLVTGDAREAAKILSCHQDIAADGAVCFAMLAEFDAAIDDAPWRYQQLFHEAGCIGQLLYLEAEAMGLRGTGIGCYFDDDVHRLLGLTDTTFQDLYHFTIGGALDDSRLQTLPPYAHLQDRSRSNARAISSHSSSSDNDDLGRPAR